MKEVDDFNVDKWVKSVVSFDHSVGLYRTYPIEYFTNHKLKKILTSLSESTDPLKFCLGSLINSIMTQQSPVFMITKRMLSKLVKEDLNHKGTLCHTRIYTVLMGNIVNSGFIEVLQKPSPRKGGLYKLKDQLMVSLLKELIGSEEDYSQKEVEKIESYFIMNMNNGSSKLENEKETSLPWNNIKQERIRSES